MCYQGSFQWLLQFSILSEPLCVFVRFSETYCDFVHLGKHHHIWFIAVAFVVILFFEVNLTTTSFV